MRRLIALAVLATALTGCGEAPASSTSTASTTTTTAVTVIATTTTMVAVSTTPSTSTTTTVPYRELLITGTGKVYTPEESQTFGEFGPFLWNLVTTLNGTDEIEHHPTHEWVIWGPMWGGRLSSAYEVPERYGVTDLDQVDPAAIAAAIPAGKVIVLREVPWSLDELGEYSDRLMEITSGIDTTRCAIFWGTRPGEGLHITAAEEQAGEIAVQWDLLGLPADVLQFEPSACHVFWSGPQLVPADPAEFQPE